MSLDARRRTRRRARALTERSAHARRDRRRSVGATTRSRLGARSASLVSALIEPSRRYDEESRRRGDVTRRTAAHTAARTCVDGAIGARTAKSATLGRPTTWSPLGARSASPVSALIEPSRRCDEESRRRDDATRRTAAHTAARTCVDGTTGTHTTRPAKLGRATTRSRLGARSASLVSALIEPSRRCDEESRRRGDVTRRTAAQTAARTCVDGATGATMIRVINGSDEACFLPVLSATDRIWRFHLVSFLYAALLGDGAMSPHGDASTSTLGGFASSVFKAFATNAAALTQALAARSPSQGPALPPALRTLLRAWCETDDLELGFSQMLANAGWKGDAEQMKKVGARSEIIAKIRRNADRRFSLVKAAKSAYEHAEFHKAQLERWWNTEDVAWERKQRWKTFLEGIRHALPKISVRSFHRRR